MAVEECVLRVSVGDGGKIRWTSGRRHTEASYIRWLFIALALINDPEVVFLDELTTGLDSQSRRAIWDLVRGIRDRGKTVFMTTHLMEEAERLCDRVANCVQSANSARR
jgi:ABC-type Na+ transport system ATPase subunit NatA